jgi:CRP/FNR family cyclic AMP-dependent transcriptional regulator
LIARSPDQGLIAETLKRSPLFSRWPSRALAELIAISRVRRYRHGEAVHRIQDPVRGLYVVIAGTLENSRAHADGSRFILGYAPPGETIGLVPALDGKGALADMRAHGDTAIVFIPRGPLRAMLERHPSLLHRLTMELCQRIRLYSAHLERLATQPLRQRVALALLSLANGYGRLTNAGIEIELKLSQENLAALLSASRQRVNAELRLLVVEGIVATRYSHLTILDRTRLAERIGEKGPSLLLPGLELGFAPALAIKTLSPTR